MPPSTPSAGRTDADCNDGDACTTDTCVAGACTASPIPSCSSNPPEACDDLFDNDADGLIDCSDADCAGTPTCGTFEVCGDCVDNDGDGLVDYQDPDCCAAPHALQVRRMMLRPAPKRAKAKRLRKVTVGVGAQCSQSMTQLRAKGDRMLLLP